jgi:pimeloyl-ACP methyl ester carboxylesterase
MPDLKSGRYIVNGQGLYVAISGDGPALLMLPTVTMTHAYWSLLRPHLETHLRLIMPDPLGGGRSDKPDHAEHYTIEQQAMLILGLLDELGIREASVMGAAFGGATALAVTAKARHRIRSAVLIEGIFASERLPGWAQRMHDNLTDYLVGRLAFNSMKKRSVAEGLARATMREAWRTLNADQRRLLIDAYHDPGADRRGWLAQFKGAGFDVTPMLAEVKTPILYLRGERSTAGSFLEKGVEFLKTLPNARIVAIENGAHDLHIQQPEKVAELALAFWREIGWLV